MSRTGLVLLLAFAAFPGFSLQAAEVADLYEAQVPVSTQESADRETALGVALRRVLSKVSGQRDAASHALLAAAVEAPGRFVQQFQYRIAGREESEAGDGKSFTLWVNFDAEPVDALIREAGLPVWGARGPPPWCGCRSNAKGGGSWSRRETAPPISPCSRSTRAGAAFPWCCRSSISRTGAG